MNKIEEKWRQIDKKKDFIIMCCDEFGGTMQTKASNWFSRFFEPPKKHHDRVVELLDLEIAKQIELLEAKIQHYTKENDLDKVKELQKLLKKYYNSK